MYEVKIKSIIYFLLVIYILSRDKSQSNKK